MQINIEDIISVAQAAKLCRLTRRAIYNAIHAGTLTSVEIHGRIYLYRNQVLSDWRKPVGRPKMQK